MGMRILVIGANGQTGFQAVSHLHAHSDHEPLAMIRSTAQRQRFDELGVASVLGDLEYPIDHAVHGCDAVIFAAGSGGRTGKDMTVMIDRLGAIKAAVTAHRQGVRRFILLSALNASTDSESQIRHYHRAKAHADAFLDEINNLLDGDDLLWTTVHPGRLNDNTASGTITLNQDIHKQDTTSRANTALALCACLDYEASIGKHLAVTDGETPVAEAFAGL